MFHACKFSFYLFALLILMVAAPRALAEDAAGHAATPVAEAASPVETTPVETTLKIAKTDTAIYVDDLHCKTCAKKIARKLYAVKGVVKVRSDVKANVTVVTPQAKKTLNVKSLWAAAEKAGFPPIKLVGPSGAFEPDPKTKAPVRVPEQVASKRQ